MYHALFVLYLEPSLRAGSDAKGVVTCLTTIQGEFKASAEVIRMAARSAADFVDSTAITKRVIQRSTKRVRKEP
jgi:hypothetical protein